MSLIGDGADVDNLLIQCDKTKTTEEQQLQLYIKILIYQHINRIEMNQAEPNKQKKIGYYLIGKTIGQGTFGKVKLGTHTLTGERVAIKILVKQKIIDVADVERVSRQIHILKLIRHPSIIQLYEIIQTSRHLFLVMEYIQNGQLFDYIVKNTKIDQKQACKYFKQIISGVAYLHRLNIVHRDLKPQNLLIDWKNSLKIVDFGLSNTYKKDQMLKTACGSPCYAAPQMIASKKYHGLQVDIWSCGVILFAMVCGYLPFQDSNTSQLYKKILSGQYILPSFISSEFKDLLEKILNVDPTKRYSLEQIYSHPWCKQVGDIPLNSGIMVGYHRMPIDQQILSKLSQFNFDLQYCSRCIEANKHNHITTTYYLLLKKHLRSGHKSNADIGSPEFDYSAIEPFRRVETQSKYQFFGGTHTEKNPIIDIQIGDINVSKKGQKAIFNIKPNTSKNKDKLNYVSEHRKSNQLIQSQQKRLNNNSNKQFHDLRMYLKAPRKKQYFSETKRKKDQKQRNMSVYYQPKKQNVKESDDQYIIRLQTEQSQQKRRTRSKYNKIRPYNRASKLKNF